MTKTLLVMVACCATLLAGPIDVSYSVSGSAGNWTLDFSVANNLAGAPNQAFYLFGVELSDDNITGSPASFPDSGGTFTNAAFGGSSTIYNNLWYTDPETATALPGSTTSGFQVTISDSAAPASVNWFAYTYGNTPYTGGGNFNNSTNPGFEGSATEDSGGSVPEPSTLAILGSGLAGLIALRRRKTA